ncbi:MAG: proteasome-activating nucleotidase [Nanoarchaeota archaeon]
MPSAIKKSVTRNYMPLYEENRSLRSTVSYLKDELDRLKEPPLLICDIVKLVGNKAVVRLPNNNNFFVNISTNLIGKVNMGDRVLTEQKSLVIVEKLDRSKNFDVENFVIVEKPNLPWSQIGGLQAQIRELKEVIELPLKNPELFERVGIQPPKGVLLHGPSGTGKTILGKAVAHSTNATFIEIVGSELVQKFIGEGAKLVKDIFKLAREKAPSLVFIDELDSIASERMDIGTSGEREVQRTFMQLLSEIDGFDPLGNVKIIGATNRPDVLDSAIIRPGRLDRLIYVPLPEAKGREEIFKIHTKNMNMNQVDLRQLADLTEGSSGAEVRAVCTEAGYFAIRENRTKVGMRDFIEAIAKVSQEDKDKTFKKMFG